MRSNAGQDSTVSETAAAPEFYDRRYSDGYMDDYYWDANTKRKRLEVIQSLGLPSRGKALDFGCGQGALTPILETALPGWQIFGTDISRVAIDLARQKRPDITFFVSSEDEYAGTTFDFIFTNHVLEHVEDLEGMLDVINARLTPDGSVLHVLPCGTEGSLEHRLCLMRKGGIDAERGNRFFFEEPGHLRRLTSEDVASLYRARGFVVNLEYYSNHDVAALESFTRSWRFLLSLTDPREAVSPEANASLRKMRRRYLPSAVMRVVADKFERTWRKRGKSVSGLLLLCAGLPFYPAAKLLDDAWKRDAWREWEERKTDNRGGEMFLHFVRKDRSSQSR
jgi:SAM-dependent methyltransferase